MLYKRRCQPTKRRTFFVYYIVWKSSEFLYITKCWTLRFIYMFFYLLCFCCLCSSTFFSVFISFNTFSNSGKQWQQLVEFIDGILRATCFYFFIYISWFFIVFLLFVSIEYRSAWISLFKRQTIYFCYYISYIMYRYLLVRYLVSHHRIEVIYHE